MIIPNTWKNKKLSKPPTSWLPDGNSNIGSFLEVLLDMKFLEQQKKHEASVFPDPKWFKCLKALVTIGENVVVQYFQQRTNHPQSMMFPYFTIEMLSGRLTKGHIYIYVCIYIYMSLPSHALTMIRTSLKMAEESCWMSRKCHVILHFSVWYPLRFITRIGDVIESSPFVTI